MAGSKAHAPEGQIAPPSTLVPNSSTSENQCRQASRMHRGLPSWKRPRLLLQHLSRGLPYLLWPGPNFPEGNDSCSLRNKHRSRFPTSPQVYATSEALGQCQQNMSWPALCETHSDPGLNFPPEGLLLSEPGSLQSSQCQVWAIVFALHASQALSLIHI